MTRAALTLFVLLAAAPLGPAQEKIDFARDVLPILSNHCFQCHGPDEKARKGDLRLDTKQDALRKTGAVIVPGKSGASEVIRRIETGERTELMPPPKANKPLKPEQVAVLKRWIDQGAAWGTHWSFTAPTRPAAPRTKHPTKNPIDAFVRARLEQEKLAPAPEADRERLIRRVTLDLTGLPPTPAEVDAFRKDAAPDAYEKVVARLLASPRFGERMAWDWLDAARFADSNGYQGDGERTMWPWRDWVVKAYNENLPFDQFTVWQLAGDLVPNPSREQILATAFNRNHMINGEGGRIAEENRVEYVFDQTETTGTVWLGLTVGCARCHDHKFDPVTRNEYFGLFAYFNQTPVTGSGGSGQTPPVLDFGTAEQEQRKKATQAAYDELVKRVAPIEKRLRDAAAIRDKNGTYASTLPALIESALRKGPGDRADQNYDELVKHFKGTEPEYAKLLPEVRKAKHARDAAGSALPKVMVMGDAPKPRDTFVLTRGDYSKKEGQVAPHVPTFGSSGAPPARPGAPRQNRLDLARWIVSNDNPLTARVAVNRLWQMFFGTGLVKTSEDFGVQGARPSHPGLLDWLAVEYRTKWDTKHLVELIVTSATYRQSAKVSAELLERDPDNRLLARGPRHRLPSWMIRDQALAASGLLAPALGGPPVKTYQPPGIWEEATFGNKRYVQDKGEALYRRSLYVFWRRIVGPTTFFDAANRQTCSVKTTTTNTPLHALVTLNDTTYVEAARALAQLALETGATDAERLSFAFRRVVARKPNETELKVLSNAWDKQRTLFTADKGAALELLKVGASPRNEKLDPVGHAALTVVCLMLLNLDEALNK
ncbi:MAG TPA: PSD1 and planctomycete cytochrome C domain-containing protein [Gemmata sp.]